ncbi:MAG: hypothetical protein MJY98_02690 [Fibrobacter sp.]|nr:hypothetical protein [Fibrobacter sp.]
MSKNILVSTLGASWSIIPETLSAFLYNEDFDFYRGIGTKDCDGAAEWFNRGYDREILAGGTIDEVWLISTDQVCRERVLSLEQNLEKIGEWQKSYGPAIGIPIRVWVLKGVPDIASESDASGFRDLTMRVMALAQVSGCAAGERNKVIVSLACGRKTMSADMQDAAYCFGCRAMMHVLGDTDNKKFIPVKLKQFPKSDLLDGLVERQTEKTLFGEIDETPLDGFENIKVLHFESDGEFLRMVDEKRDAASYFYSSFWSNQVYDYETFPILYTLSGRTQECLRNFRMGVNPEKAALELDLLRGLPKADLHCHLGGCLSVEEMIRVACRLKEKVQEQERLHPAFARWNSLPPEEGESWKSWRSRVAEETGVEHIYVAPKFLCSYAGRAAELESLMYGDFLEEQKFVGVASESKEGGETVLNLAPYEMLGDLQGSALLCHRETLEECVRVLLENSRSHNVRYLEVRCSPINYASSGYFEKEEVVETILDVLEEFPQVKSSIVFIASRHSDAKRIVDGVELYKKMMRESRNDRFRKYFRGFDLAGNEASKKAEEMTHLFQPIKEACLNITIHAGETMPVDSVWQAVYCLNAERIGHGLTLVNNAELMNKFRDRRIGVEMCPSSNFQIIGFKDNYFADLVDSRGKSLGDYPMQRYLRAGLRVCVNTDDPGISRTDMTRELHKASRLTRGGLSLWEVFALLYNSFDLAFLPYNEKRDLLNRMNAAVKEWISGNINKIEGLA